MDKINKICRNLIIFIFLLSILLYFYLINNNILDLSYVDFSNIFFVIWGYLIGFIYLNSIFGPFYFFVFYINISRLKNCKRIENKEIIYMRDLPNYNCAVAGYLYEGIIDVENDYKALLMELTTRKYLTYTNGLYTVNEDYLISNPLLEGESVCEYVINVVRGAEKLNEKKFKKMVLDDCLKLRLVENTSRLLVLVLIFFFTGGIMHIVAILFISAKTSLLDEMYFKFTDKGSLERDKMIKLKAFLHDFSTIKDINKEENNIWDKYLAYAVSLEENENFNK